MIFCPLSQINNFTEKHVQKEISPSEFWVSSSFKVPRLINFSHHLHLLVKKIFRVEVGYKAEVILIFENGKPIQISEQFRSLFDQQLSKSQTIDYSLKFQKQYFHLVLTISLDIKGQVLAISEPDFDEVIKMMKKVQNLLLLSGVLKTKNRLSLKTLKMELELKKNVAQSLSPSQKIRSLSPMSIQPEKKLIQRFKIQQLPTAQQKQKKGGSFLVQKKLCKLTKTDGSTFEVTLAKKKARSSKDQQKKRKAKLVRELGFIQQIHSDQYFLKCYLDTENQSCFYLDYIPNNLKDIIYDKSVKVDERFSLANQLIQAISILHASNIVHRDLKPENILVQTVDLNKKLKIIDFGESSFIQGPHNSEFNLGCSPPYSPIQCLMDIEAESYNQPEIDLWSVIMIIYELIFRRLPIYYNRNIQLEIINGWRTEGDFSVILCHRKKLGFHKIQEIINLLIEQGLRINQKQRVSLSSMKSFMKAIKNFDQNLNELQNYL